MYDSKNLKVQKSKDIYIVSTKEKKHKMFKYDIADNKPIGRGANGNVYRVVECEKKQTYAMKALYVEKKEKENRFWNNELRFHREVSLNHPEFFTQLVHHEWIEKCADSYADVEIPAWFTDEARQYTEKLKNDGLCLRRIYTLVDQSLDHETVDSMDRNQIYSMLIQLLYINYVVEQAGVVHGDFHMGNMGIKNVDVKKTVRILTFDIPTFGRQFQMLDFDGILFEDTSTEKNMYPSWQSPQMTDLQHYNEHRLVDKLGIINTTIDSREFWKFVTKNKLKLSFEDDMKTILKQDETQHVLKSISDHSYILFDSFRLLFPMKFQTLVLRSENIPCLNKVLLPVSDLLFVYQNIHHTERLIRYFIYRLEDENAARALLRV